MLTPLMENQHPYMYMFTHFNKLNWNLETTFYCIQWVEGGDGSAYPGLPYTMKPFSLLHTLFTPVSNSTQLIDSLRLTHIATL